MYQCKFKYILIIHLVVLSVVGLSSSVHVGSLQNYGHNETVLGNGAGGTVYLYRNDANSTAYAVKKFDLNIWGELEAVYLGRIKSEFYIAASLNHDHIIKTLDLVYLEEHAAWFQVMEYCPWSLWDKAIRTEVGMPAAHAMCVFRQILDAVSYMHAEGIAHHDLKLSNVMLDFDGNAKIIDFGTSYRFRGLDQNVIEMRWDPWGARPFLPPEVYEESKYDPRGVDIWALAMIFCQLMLPALPWKSMPVPCDILDDQFGIFSLSAILEVYGEGEGRSSISMQRQQRCVGLGTASDVEDIRATLETLLDLLPQESRHVIGRMMEPLPAERAGWAEILSDPWVRQIECATARNAR